MNKTLHKQTSEPMRVGDLNQKLVSVFLSILLALMCLPILPKEAQAETVTVPTTTTYTGYMQVGGFQNWLGFDVANETVPGVYGGGAFAYVTLGSSTNRSSVVADQYVPLVAGTTYTGTNGSVPVSLSYTTNGITFNYSGTASYSYDFTCYSDSGVLRCTPGTGSFDFSGTLTFTDNQGFHSVPLTDVGSVPYEYTVTTTTSQSYDPIATAPDWIGQVGDALPAYNWTDGVTATWGYTTSNIIVPSSTANGTIVDQSLPSALPNNGTFFTGVGVEAHNYKIKDSTGDSTFADAERNIIVKAVNEPDFTIIYGTGAVDKDGVDIAGQPYNGEWTNQPLDMTASYTDPGTYDTVIRKYDAPTPSSSFNNEASASASSVSITGYNGVRDKESPDTTGNDFTSILQAEDPMVPGTYIDLSPESGKKNVKIDNTKPNPTASYNTSTQVISDTSTDALSGIDGTRQKAALVPTGTAPTSTDYVAFSALDVSVPGYYDVWVWAWDIAGNNDKAKALTNIFVKSSAAPTISGATSDGTLASNTWTNKPVTVTVTPPASVTNGYTALYDQTIMPETLVQVDTSQNTVITQLYTAETAGTDLFGVLLDSLGTTEITDRSGIYTVKIDTTKPVANLNYNGSPTFDFTDTSTDTDSLVANSGVDGTKTVIAIMPFGTLPVAADYVALASSVVLPDTEDYYDVWAIATDNAGNVSDPVKVYDHITRSGKDKIDALDFAWDIDSGSASFDDAMAKMLSHVEGMPWGSSTPFDVTLDLLVDPSELADIVNAIDAGQKGTSWPLTFKTPAGTAQAEDTITVTLFQHGPTPGPTPPPGPLVNELIYGNDFNWGVSSGPISDDNARAYSQVTAYDINGDPIATNLLNVDQTELGAINAAIAAGLIDTTWPLTFTTPGDGTATTVQVTLFGNGPVPPVPGSEQVVGNDFRWGISTGHLDDASAFYLSAAEATAASGAPLPTTDIIVDAADLAAINDAIDDGLQGTVWPLTLTTRGNTGPAATTAVYVTLYNAGPVVPPVTGDEHIVGNDFNWGITAGSLTEPSAFALSQAKAADGTGHAMDLTNVVADTSDLAAINAAVAAGQKGTVWPLKLTTKGLTGTPATATVMVTLFDNGPVPPGPGTEHIVGNDFNWGISTGNLDKASAEILSLLEATAGDGTDIDLTTVTVDQSELDAINAAIAANLKDTTWPLTFTTDGSTGTAATVTVNVTLFNNGPVLPPVSGSEHIVGNDFNWGISSGSMTDAQAAFLGRVTATGADGSLITYASYDAAELAAINAAIAAGLKDTTWPLTFTTGGATGTAASVTVNVTLFHAGPPVVTPGDPHIVANNFDHPITAGVLTGDIAKTLAQAAALASDGTRGLLADITVDPADLAAINAAIAAGDVSTPLMPLNFTYTCPITGKTVSTKVMVNLLGSAGLEVIKTVDNANPLPGDVITYTITVKNTGVATAQGLWIKDYVPEATTFVSCDAAGKYGATASGKEYVNWYLASLASGYEITYTMKVKVNECTPGTVIKNIALYEENVPAFPSNPDNDPQGGQTDPATSTVGDNTQPGKALDTAKTTPKTGDAIPYAAVAVIAALALFVVFWARRKGNDTGAHAKPRD